MNRSALTISVLSLQGCVDAHKPHITALGANFKAIKTASEINEADAIIIPGGESTTMLRLLDEFNLWETLKAACKTKPVWGICAGAILLAENVTNPTQKSLGAIPISIERNAYGRQLDSHHAKINDYEVSFIRAPKITKIDKSVAVLANHKGLPAWASYKNVMVTTFHPELNQSTPSPMHKEFFANYSSFA